MLLAFLLATSIFGAGWIARDLAVEDAASVPVAATATAGHTAVVTGSVDEPVALVAELLGPAVVQISADQSLGSGVVYDTGLVLTNAHVVGSRRQVDVKLQDGTTVAGEVLGTDPSSDVAVVALDVTGLTVATLAAEAPRVGDLAVAVGSPFGLAQSVTAGVVSAVDRPVNGDAGIAVNMIQTDAPINPGNSGGALANRRGEVIGINTSIFSRSGDNSGIGFAIPIGTARTIADRIVAGQPLDKGYLGVRTTVSEDGRPGALVDSVDRATPAAAAGIRAGDLIVAVDGVAVKAPDELGARIAQRDPGAVVVLELERDGGRTTLEVTLAARP